MSKTVAFPKVLEVSVLILFCASVLAAAPDSVEKARAEAEVYAQRSLDARKKSPPKLTPARQKAEELMDQANAVISQSENPTQIMPAIRLYQEAVKVAPDYDKAWWGLAMALWGKAMLMPGQTKDEKQAVFAVLAQARNACDRALTIDPNSPGGNYWLSNIILTEGSLKNIVQQAVILPEVFRLTDKVAAVDPYFENGAIFRTYATVLIVVPQWLSKTLGFAPEIIIPYLDKAIELEPGCFVNYVTRAGVYYKINDKAGREKALKDLEYVLTHNPDSLKGYEADNRTRQNDARALWTEITGKDYPVR